MNSNRAKELLLDYRPGLVAPSPELTEALRLAQRDPELVDWFTAQQQFHVGVREKLRNLEVPFDLKQRILASRKVVPVWQKHLQTFAAAAVLVGLIAIAAVWFQPRGEQITVAGFQNRMVGFAVREYRMDLLSEDPKVIRDFLAQKGAPADYVFPSPLDTLQPMGCARLSWQGHPVAMVCYKLTQNDVAYVFVMEAEALRASSLPLFPELKEIKGLSTAAWAQDGNLYFVAAPLPESELKKLVSNSRGSI